MRKLSLQDWASIAEVIGGIAVVMSLFYVGYQIRENASEIRASNRQALVSRSGQAVGIVAGSPELAGAFASVAIGSPLTPVESTQYQYFVRGLLYAIQEAYLLHREGRLDDEYWNTRAAIVVAYRARPSARTVYNRDKGLGVLHPDYVRWLDQALDDRYGN
jgi:hypothetical protein